MRHLGVPVLLLSLVVSASVAVACAAPESESTDDQTGAVTGGKSEDNSPLVLLLTSAEATGAPACVGTMLSERIVVTEKKCAKRELVVKRAAADAKTTSRIKAIHVPTEANAEIALLELATPLEGKTARLAATELGGGYHIVGATTLASKGDASIVKGTIATQTDENGLIVPEKGKQICDSDIGASVFRKIPGRALGFLWKRGNWELSGLIVGRDGASAPAVTTPDPMPEPSPEPTPDPGTPDAEAPAPEAGASMEAGAPTAAKADSCSGGAWRVAPLALHAAFLKKYAPEAFPQPKPEGGTGGGGILGGGFPFPFPFPGSSTGTGSTGVASLKSCTLVTATLPATKTGERTASIQAKASFANAAKERIVGQFGIAPKSSSTSMTWSPATALDAMSGTTFESRFEGGVNAPATEGEYLIAFRASADGGATWTECDLDGSQNGYSLANALALQVTPTAPVTANPAPEPSYPSTSSNDTNDSSNDSASNEDKPAPKKKSSDDDSGCSVAHVPGSTSGLPFAALLLGLAAIARRRASKRH
jgi:MYXO-CTERM domain-containing protein